MYWIHLVLTFGSISVLFLVSIDPDAIIGNQSEFKRWQSLEAVSIGAVLLFVFSVISWSKYLLLIITCTFVGLVCGQMINWL